MIRELTLKRKIEFLDYAIKYYSKDLYRFDSICILFVDVWLKRPDLRYGTIEIKFPELWTKIEKILKRQKEDSVIRYKSFTKGRIRLLERVRNEI